MKMTPRIRLTSAVVSIVITLLGGRSVAGQDTGTEFPLTAALKMRMAEILGTGRFQVTTDPIRDVVVVSDRLAGGEFDYAYAVSNILETVDLLAQKLAVERQKPLAFGIIYRANPLPQIADMRTTVYRYSIPLDVTLVKSYRSSQTPAQKTRIVKELLAKGETPGWRVWNFERPFSSVVVEDPAAAATVMSSSEDVQLRKIAVALRTANEAEVAKIAKTSMIPVNNNGAELWARWAKMLP
jgi:hypothetical protein